MKRLLNYFLLVVCFVATLLLVLNTSLVVEADIEYPFKGAITSGTLVVHNAPNTLESSYETEIAYGTVVDVLEKVSGKNLYKIKYNDNLIGYVSSNL